MNNFDSFLYDASAFGDAYYNPATVDGAFALPSELAPSVGSTSGSQSTLEEWLAFDANLASLPATDSLQTMYSTLSSYTTPAPAQDYISTWSAPSPVSFGAVSDLFGLGSSISLDKVFAPSHAPANVFTSGDVFAPLNTLAPGDLFASNNAVTPNNAFAVADVFAPNHASGTIDIYPTSSTTIRLDAAYLPPSPATSVSSLSSVFSVPTSSVPTPATSVSSPASSSSPPAPRSRAKKDREMITLSEYKAFIKLPIPAGDSVKCPVDSCGQHFTGHFKHVSLPRHIALHLPKDLMDDDVVKKKYCRHCKDELSRSDARKRHEDGCPSNPKNITSGPGLTRTRKSRSTRRSSQY